MRSSRTVLFASTLLATVIALGACAGGTALPVAAGFGPDPQLPAPRQGLLPTVNIAPASSWPEGATPEAAAGLRVQAFATGLDHPRWLYRLPNGDILVAESNAPPKPEDKKGGLRGWVMGKVMAKAGAGVPSPNKIVLLRDADGDGVAEIKSDFLTGLNSPFGMALVGDRLYVANADAVVAFPYQSGQTQIDAAATKITDLPAGRNHHWTKSLVASPDGRRLYVGVGSNSNVGENGLDEEVDRATILEIDPATGARQVYASGMRNPVGMDWNPQTGQLWVAVNERDEIGDDLVPDYMTSVAPGAFYGWPWSYYGQNVDTRPPRQSGDGRARVPTGLRSGGAHGVAGADIRTGREPVAASLALWCLRRPARVVEPQRAQRLQGDLRAVRRWTSRRAAAGCSDRISERPGSGSGPACGSADRSARRAAGRR